MLIVIVRLSLIICCWYLGGIHGNGFYDHVPMSHVPILRQFYQSDYHSLDINKVLTHYIIKISRLENDYELRELQRGVFALIDNEYRLLYRYYGTAAIDLINVQQLEDELAFFISLASPIVIDSFTKVRYVDTDRFEEDIIKTGRHWLIIFVKDLIADEISFHEKQTLALVGEDLFVYHVQTGLVQCNNNLEFCDNIEAGVTMRLYPYDVQYSGNMNINHNDIVSFVLKYVSAAQFFRPKTKSDLTELTASRDVVLITEDKGLKMRDIFVLDVIANIQSGLNVARINCTQESDLCKLHNSKRAAGMSVILKTQSDGRTRETFVSNALDLDNSAGRMNAMYTLMDWVSANVELENVVGRQKVEKMLAEGVNEITILWTADKQFLWQVYKHVSVLKQKTMIYIEKNDTDSITGLKKRGSFHILYPSTIPGTTDIITFTGKRLTPFDFDLLIFLSTVLSHPGIARLTDDDHPPKTDAFVTINLHMCYNTVSQQNFLTEMGYVISDMAVEACNSEAGTCSYHFNVGLEEDKCSLEVVRDGVEYPYYYGYMVSDNFKEFLRQIRDLKVVKKIGECGGSELGYVMGDSSSDGDNLFLNQVIAFGLTLKEDEEICFILDAAKENNTTLGKDDNMSSVNLTTEEEDVADVHVDQEGWWPDPKNMQSESESRTLNRMSYLFKLNTGEHFDKEVPSIDEIGSWYFAKQKPEISETVPWDILEKMQKGKAIVLLYFKNTPDDSLKELNEINSKMEDEDISKLDCSQYKTFCRKMQEGKKLPLVVVLDRQATYVIPVSRKKNKLRNALNDHVTLTTRRHVKHDHMQISHYKMGAPRSYHFAETDMWRDVREKLEEYRNYIVEEEHETGSVLETGIVQPPIELGVNLKDEL